MKNFRKITLGLLLSAQVLGAFYGCSSDSFVNQESKSLSITEENQNSNVTHSITNHKRSVRKLSIKDFNFIGEKHNELMLSFLNNYCTNPVSKRESFISLNYDFSDSKVLGEVFDLIQSKSNEEMHEFVLNNLSDKKSRDIFNSLRNILLTTPDYNTLVLDLSKKEKEIELINNPLDYNVLMTYSYIAKNSAKIWFPEIEGGMGITDCYSQDVLSKGGSKINKTRTRTESDVLGGAFGMVGWALAGGSAGPFGVVGGLIAATVYGAVTGSI